MSLDRLTFLAFASSLAAVACSTSTAEDDVDEGAVVGAACVAPGAITSQLSADQRDYCETFAESAERKGEHYESVRDTCLGYLTAFKSNVAGRARACLHTVENAAESDFWPELYDCGYVALDSVCPDPQVESTCAALGGSSAITRTGSRDPDAVKAECRAFLSGLEPRARENVVSCVKSGPYPVFSCIEGLRPESLNTCIPPGSNPGRIAEVDNRAACDRELSVQASKDLCIKLVANTEPDVAKEIVKRMTSAAADHRQAGREVSEQEMFKIGLGVLRDACRQPAAVDSICAEGVRALVSHGASNAGGRLTNECRTLLAGMTSIAREHMKGVLSSIQNAAAYTQKPGSLSQTLHLLSPCPNPHPNVCLPDSEG